MAEKGFRESEKLRGTLGGNNRELKEIFKIIGKEVCDLLCRVNPFPRKA